MTKSEKIEALGLLRKRTHFDGFHDLGEYHSGAYDCEYVSPYTLSAGNFDARVAFILQDWASHESLIAKLDMNVVKLGYTPSQPTNVNLIDLLRRHLNMSLDEVFVTNLFPFIKSGGDSARIPAKPLRRAASMFAIPQVRIVHPVFAVCLGLQVFNTLRSEFGLKQVKNLDEGMDSSFEDGGTQYRCQAHTGTFGRINRNHRGCVERDWRQMSCAFRKRLELEI